MPMGLGQQRVHVEIAYLATINLIEGSLKFAMKAIGA